MVRSLFLHALFAVAVIGGLQLSALAGFPPDPGLATGMIVSSATLDALRNGFKTTYQNYFSSVTPLHGQVATPIPSATLMNTYGWLGEFPAMRRWVGDKRIKSLNEKAYILVNEDFEATISVHRNKIKDDSLGIYTPMMQGIGQSAANLPDQLVFDLIPAGFGRECYDGQNFFDTEHPVGDGVVANMQDGVGNPWFLLDCSKPLKPFILQIREAAHFVALDRPDDENVFKRAEYLYGAEARMAAGYAFWQAAFASRAPLTPENYRAAREAMTGLKTDEGEPLGVKPTHLVFGGSNLAAARKLILTEKVDGGDSNIWQNDVALLEAPRLA